jgi:ubiquinone biosynthesis protein
VSHLLRLNKVLNIIAKYRLDEFAENQIRIGWIKFLLLPHRLIWAFSDHSKDDKNRRLRLALEELGPIYIKFGQLLSTRPDFIDTELAEELQSLQDNVPPFKSPSINQLVEQALGKDISEVFSRLEVAPLASASVAQVHEATLLTGEKVVVKVIRPGIRKTIAADISLLNWMAATLETKTLIGKRLRPIEVVRDYQNIIFDELNLLAEAANTSQLRRNFENSPDLYVPKIYWDFTRKNMLVMERIHGIPVADIDQLQKNNINLKKLAETGVDIFFTQVFEHNFFHADMHPGNIFVDRASSENPKYIAIDCAIIGSLSKNDQEYLAKNLLAIFKRDYRKIAELHVACGWVPKETRIHEFESAMRSVCEPIFGKPLKDISFGQLLVQLFRTAGRFNMEVQPSLVLLQKTLLNVEGLGRQLYPELDLWRTALPYLENWNTKRLNPFALLTKVQENIPNWVDQLPELPQLLIDTATESRQLTEINESLRAQQFARAKESLRQQRLAHRAGIAVIALALASLLPSVNQLIGDIAAAPLFLGFLGVFLLCFRR